MKITTSLLICFALANHVCCQDYKTEVMLTDLQNPCGVAIQPVTGKLFVSDTGNGRIVRLDLKEQEEMIVDFPVQEFELDSSLMLGPLGLIFRDKDTLVVGTGGSDDGEDSISVFDLTKKKKDPLKAEDAESVFTIESNEEGAAEGDFFSFALTRKALYATCGGDADYGWVVRADLAVKEIKDFRRYIPTKRLTRTAAPSGIAISPGGHVVVAQMGSRDTAGDSTLAFYSSAGELIDKFPTGLNDIVALAYGPRKKRLFALDFSWDDPKKGGLYQLVAVDNAAGCTAKLIKKFERPTAMTFDRSGNLYITTCGFEVKQNDDLPPSGEAFVSPGKLVVVRNVD